MSTAAPRLAIMSRGAAPSNVELVAEALREAIVRGWVKPGERVKEVPLAEQLGVSRGPIREAIRLLEHDGLLEILPNRGAIVPQTRSSDLLEVYALRAALGSLAVHKIVLEDRPLAATLEREIERFRRAVERRRGSQAAEADLRYQSALVACSGLPRVTRQFDQLTWQVRIFIATLDSGYDDKLPQMLGEVEDLHAAILDRDGPRAERLWREKFERWVRDFVGQLDESFDADLWGALTYGSRRQSPASVARPLSAAPTHR